MEFTVKQIAEYLNGEVIGNELQLINQFYKIEEGKSKGISFLANSKYENYIYNTDSSAVIVSRTFVPKEKVKPTLIKVDDPYVGFANLLKLYKESQQPELKSISKSAEVAKNALIAENVEIGAFTVIHDEVEIGEGTIIGSNVFIGKKTKIGTNTKILSNVCINANSVIGDNCVLKNGVVIGGEGFGFAPNKDGSYEAIPQIGNVIIENNVHIGANTCIDCGTMGSTIISEGVKIDNLVQIAHNVFIGKHTVIAALTGIAGSVKIGNYCVIAGQVGITGHIKIADYSKIGAKSGVNRSIKESNLNLSGVPAFNLKDYLRSSSLFRKLPNLEKRINEIERLIKNNN